MLVGQIAVGKTSVARLLERDHGYVVISARQALAERLPEGETPTRGAMQRIGAELEAETGGTWLSAFVDSKSPASGPRIVDSARTVGQVDELRRRFSTTVVYLEAPIEIRRARFSNALLDDPLKSEASFEESVEDRIEMAVVDLKVSADVVISTQDTSVAGVAAQIRGL